MYRIFAILAFLSGCTSTIQERDVINMPLSKVISLAEKGNNDAVHALCYRYMYGYDGAIKNYEAAYRWCNKAVVNGHSSSITLLAELYYLGNYVEQDYSVAFKLYMLAAKDGHRHAQFILYIMYLNGQGTELDKQKSTYWLQKAAKNGHSQAIKIVNG